MHQQQGRRDRDQADRREILARIVSHVAIHARAGCQCGRVTQQEGVAVGRAFRDLACADCAAAAGGPVFDHDLLAKRGYDPAFGARPLRRIITNLIEDPLSEGVLEARFHIGDVVVVDVATLESGETYLRLRPAREVNAEVEEEEGAIA